MTTGALYHHLQSKPELCLVVLEAVEELPNGRFRVAAGLKRLLAGRPIAS